MGRPKGSKNGQHTLIDFVCERCGKSFSRQPSNAVNARYCSMDCYKPKPDPVACETCGKLYIPHPSERGRFCSNECRRNQVEKVCPRCGKHFFVKASHATRRSFCSVECRKAQVQCQCAHCGKPFTVNKARGEAAQYCSKECLHAQGRRTITCLHCGNQRTIKKHRANQFCCNRCATVYRMEHGWENDYIANKRRTGYRTDIEAMTEAVLLQLGIPYMFEHKVGRYSVDFLLPMIGVALECDGWQHNTAKGRERDIKRDAALQAEGWTVVHVADSVIRANASDAIRSSLQPFLEIHSNRPSRSPILRK